MGFVANGLSLGLAHAKFSDSMVTGKHSTSSSHEPVGSVLDLDLSN